MVKWRNEWEDDEDAHGCLLHTSSFICWNKCIMGINKFLHKFPLNWKENDQLHRFVIYVCLHVYTNDDKRYPHRNRTLIIYKDIVTSRDYSI